MLHLLPGKAKKEADTSETTGERTLPNTETDTYCESNSFYLLLLLLARAYLGIDTSDVECSGSGVELWTHD